MPDPARGPPLPPAAPAAPPRADARYGAQPRVRWTAPGRRTVREAVIALEHVKRGRISPADLDRWPDVTSMTGR